MKTDPEQTHREGARPEIPAPRPRGRPKLVADADQRRAIIATAWKLLVDHGYEGMTMNAVVAACRMSKRTVYHLFPSKKDLFVAVVEQHRQSMLALPAPDDGIPLKEALERIFQIDIGAEAAAERLALMRVILVESRRNPEIAAIARQYGGDRSLDLLVEWLSEQKALGRIGVDEPKIAARMMLDVVFGAISLKDGDEPEWPSEGDRVAYLRKCIAVIVDGIGQRADAV
jgi:AcrR family transcriptional regulator